MAVPRKSSKEEPRKLSKELGLTVEIPVRKSSKEAVLAAPAEATGSKELVGLPNARAGSKESNRAGSKESERAGSKDITERAGSKESKRAGSKESKRGGSKEVAGALAASGDALPAALAASGEALPAGAMGSGLAASGDVLGSVLAASSDFLRASGDITGSAAVGGTASMASGLMASLDFAAGTAMSQALIASVPEEEEDEGRFKAEPLHVRYICRAEHRRTTHEILSDEKKLQEMQAELEDAATSEERRIELPTDIKRLQYQVKLERMRIDRLGGLNPKTHEQLPEQLIAAAREGDCDFVRLAYDAKVDLDVQDPELLVTPLIIATISNKVSAVKLLLEMDANPRVQDVNGATCVHYAVQLDHIHALATVLDDGNGRNFDTLTMKDSRGMSPVDYARRPERRACLRLMQNRMGGPIPVVWQVFKGWLTDKTGCCRPHVVKRRGCFL